MKLIVRAQNYGRHCEKIKEIEWVARFGGNPISIESRPGQVILISEESLVMTPGAVILQTLSKNDLLKNSPDIVNHFKNFSWFQRQDAFLVITDLVMPIPNRTGISATTASYWEALFLRTMYDILMNVSTMENQDRILCVLKNHELACIQEMGNWPLDICGVSDRDEDSVSGGYLEMSREKYQIFSDAWIVFDRYERDLEWQQGRLYAGVHF